MISHGNVVIIIRLLVSIIGKLCSTLSHADSKLIKLVKIPNSLLQSCVRSVPRYHFKLAYLQIAVKELFLKPASENGDIGHFNL